MTSTGNGMEVDPPNGRTENDALGLNPLKRSNSAPMLASTATTTPTSGQSPIQATSSSLSFSFTSNSISKTCERIRRYSSSSMSLHSPTTPIKIPSRLDQIKHEERINIKELEAAQEKDIHSAMQLSQSWEELSLTDHEPMAAEISRRPRSFQEPLHIHTPPYPYTSSPSPTRIGKQCFSPSLGYPVSTVGNALSPSPSPTRKFTRRSHSPIIFQPSRLGPLKRKINVDSDGGYESYTPPKRILLNHSPGINPDSSHAVSHPLLHSISSSSLSDTSSPETHETSTSACMTPQVTSGLTSHTRRRNTPSPLCTYNSFQAIDSLPDSGHASNISHTESDSSDMVDNSSAASGFRRPTGIDGGGG